MSENINQNFLKLTKEGEAFINYICNKNANGNDLLRGNNGVLPFSNGVNQTWVANIKKSDGTIASKNSELAPLLIKWFNQYAALYDLDPNILAAQAYIESNYKMWIYPKESSNSTASGIVQFTMPTVYDIIINKNYKVIPFATTDEINTIINGLTGPYSLSSYQVAKGSPATNEVAINNRPILHQNIIDNPEIMIKAQARYLRYFSENSNKLASTSLYCYNTGMPPQKTYSEVIKRNKNEDLSKGGVDYVFKIFTVLGDKSNSKYKPENYWFGYNLGMNNKFDAATANMVESEKYGKLNTLMDNLSIESNKKYNFLYFPEYKYVRESSGKKDIVLHHTMSGDLGLKNVKNNSFNWWNSIGEKAIITFIISRDGNIYQLFSTNYWGDNLELTNITEAVNNTLNSSTISISLESWGALINNNNSWYPAFVDVNSDVQILQPILNSKPVTNIQEYNSFNGYDNGFRKFYAFEKYTSEQIQSLYELINSIREKYSSIPLTSVNEIWDLANKNIGCPNISTDALNNQKSGIWTHASFRADKSDCHPQPELLNLINELK